MKKKVLAWLLVAVCAVALTACGGSNSQPTAAKSEPAKAESAAPAETKSEAPAATEEKSEAPAATEEKSEAPAEEAAPAASDDEEVTLTVAGFFPPGNQHEILLNWVAEELYRRTGGTIKLEYYGTSTLLDGAGMYDGIISGIADIGMFQFGDYPGRFPEISFSETPGMYFSSCQAYGHALTEYYETYHPAELDGVKILTFECGTTGALMSNVGEIRGPQDVSGQTIRALGNAAKAVTAFGASPADVSIADCYESLRTGVIDGILTVKGAIDGFKLNEVIKHAFDYTFYNSPTCWIMNPEKYASLSPNQQKAIDEVWKIAGEEMFMNLPDDCGTNASFMEAINSIPDYHYPTDEETEAFKELLAPLVEEQAKTIDNGEEIYSRWAALAEKWNAQYPYIPANDPNAYCAHYPDTGERVITEGLSWGPNYE